MKNLKILIIEDEKKLLNSYNKCASQIFPIVICTDNLEEARDILFHEKFDCILLDNMLPDGTGISLLKEISSREEKIPTVMVTAYADKELVIDSVNAGIFHFLEKPVSKQKLLETLQKCFKLSLEQSTHKEIEQLYFISQKTATYLKKNKNISDREVEIMSCILLNHKNPDIAEKLYITSGTVKRHLHNIFEKLKITSRNELQELIYSLNIGL
ncbi:MAG: hypothetical protein A2Y25_09195 [Candidatus Melainabacteria bacterium GWF2_37_15]|nr:MAG: hypothetical protein A2Y25_09195 [Candidatus Melainabacteria bacterium GWF2_37_15]